MSISLSNHKQIWTIEDDRVIVNKDLTIINDNVFPYLDMDMLWNNKGAFVFQVNFKKNQKFKYLKKR